MKVLLLTQKIYLYSLPMALLMGFVCHVTVAQEDTMQWVQIGNDIDGEVAGDRLGFSIDLNNDGTVLAAGARNNNNFAGHVRVYDWDDTARKWKKRGKDINGEAAGDTSGFSVSLSGDGNVVAIGAPLNDDNGSDSGHARIYYWNSAAWVQRGSDIDGEAAGDHCGKIVSLSTDGNVVAISAQYNDGNGNWAGHVRVYDWNVSSNAWIKRGNDIDGEAAGDESGWSTSLSADGNVVAIGARRNNGINGARSGHVRVYDWNGSNNAWIKRGNDIDGEAAGDNSGIGVSLSADGDVVAISAPNNDGNGSDSGHVRVYDWNGSSNAWIKRGNDIDGEAAGDNSGRWGVSLSANGDVVAIGAPNNDGNGSNSGHVRVYDWNGSSNAWIKRGNDIDGEAAGDVFGVSVSLSSNGNIVAAGAQFNDGINGTDSGHVRVFVSDLHSAIPSDEPSELPSNEPSKLPSNEPSMLPSDEPTVLPSDQPSVLSSNQPSISPIDKPQNTHSGGDPHFIGFNQKLVTYQGECTLILFHSPSVTALGHDVTVHVRTTHKLDFSYISGVAMQIGKDVIEITPTAGLILNHNIIDCARYYDLALPTGLPFTLTKHVKGSKKMIVAYSFHLGKGRTIDVHVNLRQSMMYVGTKGYFPIETQGILGSPGKSEMLSRRGIPLSQIDVNVYGESWQVKDTDVQLFMEPLGPQYPQKCLYAADEATAPRTTPLQAHLRGSADTTSSHRKLLTKKVVSKEEAMAACDGAKGLKRQLCIEDTISIGDLDIVSDPFYLDA